MKIGINASFLRKPHTGIGQVTSNFLQELMKLEEGKDIEFVLYLEEKLPKKIKLPKNFKVKSFLPLWKRDDLIRKIWWEKFSLPRLAKKDRCDVFISLYQCVSIYQYMEMKHIMVVHDIIPKIFPEYLNNARKKLYWRLTERAMKKADRIIAVSKRTEKDLIEHLGMSAGKISVNYIDADEVYKKNVPQKESARVLKKYKLKPGYILAGGGYEVRKNVEGVMRTYKFLRSKFHWEEPLPPLVIYGKLLPHLFPLTADAEKLARELNLTESVKLLGEVPQKDMPAIFKNSTFFAYPSFYEGFGLPVLEAMNLGKPVVASKLSSLPEVGGDSVLYCDPNDIHDVAMVMKNLLGRRELREQLSVRARSRAKQFSWEKFCRKFLNVAKNMS
jgi:glycosyltransferase involved in cell wall biosynthesis